MSDITIDTTDKQVVAFRPFGKTFTPTRAAGVTITNWVVTPVGGADTGVPTPVHDGVTNNLGITINGEYKDVYPMQISHVSRGSSDLAETSVISTNLDDVGADRDILQATQESDDNSPTPLYRVKQYQVTFTYNKNSETGLTLSLTFDHQVGNNVNKLRDAVAFHCVQRDTSINQVTQLTDNLLNLGNASLGTSKDFFGANIPGTVNTDRFDIPHHYNQYWSSIAPGNVMKWGVMEKEEGIIDYSGADAIYSYAKQNGLTIHWHTVVWGNQFPTWLTGKSEADSKVAFDGWLSKMATRYPDMDTVQGVNEIVNETGDLDTWKNQFGGAGTTGYDWIIYLLGRVRHYFPNIRIRTNDFSMLSNQDKRNKTIDIAKVLKQYNLLDDFGCQSHYFNVNNLTPTQLQDALDDITEQLRETPTSNVANCLVNGAFINATQLTLDNVNGNIEPGLVLLSPEIKGVVQVTKVLSPNSIQINKPITISNNSLVTFSTTTGTTPIVITELDISGSNYTDSTSGKTFGDVEALQLKRYQDLFPVFWNHPNVRGITLWGYILGDTWRHGRGGGKHVTGLVKRDGSYVRPAFTFLQEYLTNGRLPLWDITTSITGSGTTGVLVTRTETRGYIILSTADNVQVDSVTFSGATVSNVNMYAEREESGSSFADGNVPTNINVTHTFSNQALTITGTSTTIDTVNVIEFDVAAGNETNVVATIAVS